MSKLPKTFQHCIRCDKDVTHEPIHTCTPSKRYRAGMEEGRKELQGKYDKALAFVKQVSKTKYSEYSPPECSTYCEHIDDARELLKELEDAKV